jgi:hypothetical protein
MINGELHLAQTQMRDTLKLSLLSGFKKRIELLDFARNKQLANREDQGHLAMRMENLF